jgi:hypothetical protein
VNIPEVKAATERGLTNLFDPGGYIGDKKLSDLFTEEGCAVFDRAMLDLRTLARFVHQLANLLHGEQPREGGE